MIASGTEAADGAATDRRDDRRVPEWLARRDVRHMHLDHGDAARFDRVAERDRIVREGARIQHDRIDPVGARGEEPVHQLALVVRLPPRHDVAGLACAAVHLVHDLVERLAPIGLWIARAERPQVWPEQVQHVHVAPTSCSTVRSSSSLTPSTTVGSPTARKSTKRTPPWNFLSIRKAVRMSCAGGSGPSVSRPSELSTRTVRCVRSSPASPLDAASRAAKTIPTATASPWDRPENASSRSSACPNVCP